MSSFIYEKDENNIVTLTMDMPNRSANIINEEFGKDFEAAVQRLTTETDLAGVIITSAKELFLAGADIDWLKSITDPKVIFDSTERMKALFRTLETLGKPVVAAINGSCMGGGLELALSCHYRIAIDSPKIQIGLPEATIGLIPGAGGITRFVRMFGLEAALPPLMEGTRFSPAKALAAKIIDQLVSDRDALLAAARTWIAANPAPRKPWDEKGYKIPGGDPKNPKVAQMVTVAPAMLTQKTHGNFPAQEAILASAVEGALVDFDTACRIESRYLAKVATGKTCKNMIEAFWFNLNAINAGGSRPKGIDRQTTRKVGVLGAGMMGSGIAYACAIVGIDVVLKDVTLEQAEKGKSYTQKLLGKQLERGKTTPEKMQAVLGRIKPTTVAADLEGCDLIIEAVFEDRELKGKVTEETEAVISETAIFASNTSTIPITLLAQRSKRPESFVGIHFFSPVDKMPLVEIIRGKQTSDAALAKAFDFVRQIKKTPIVVNDSRGFYTSRVFGTFTNEGLALLGEGQHPRAIEAAGIKAGMPVGPLAVSDEVSLSLMEHVRAQTEKDASAEGREIPRHPANHVLHAMLKTHNRAGRAAGGGFYEYPKDGGKKYLWPGLTEAFQPATEQLSQTEMIERMMFIQAIETVRCFEEGVLTSVADANIGAIFGWGFAPFKGGTLQYINDYGVKEFVARAKEFATKYGERFTPPALLVKMAEEGGRF